MSNYRARKNKGRTRRVKRTKVKKESLLKNKMVLDIVLGVVFVFSLSYLVFFSRAFEIREVSIAAPSDLGHLVMQVKGSARRELDKSFLWVLNKKSFFSASIISIRKKVLKEYPEVDAMIIKRVFPNGLFLELYNREKVAVWCYNEANCFFIDKKGVIFKSTDEFEVIETELVLIFDRSDSIEIPEAIAENKLLKNVISQEKLTQILEIEKIVTKDFSIPLQHFLTDGEEMLHAITENGLKMYFVLEENMEIIITRIKLLFKEELTPEKIKNLEYIDFRFSKVYYK